MRALQAIVASILIHPARDLNDVLEMTVGPSRPISPGSSARVTPAA
jgi:hypothetical protein